MMYMNEFDIDRVVGQFSSTSIIGKAARFLKEFRDEVNDHSDGWAYWNPPVLAARQLMLICQGKTEPTGANLRKALIPIKSFMTRRGNAAGMRMPVIG